MITIEYQSGSLLLSSSHPLIDSFLTWDPRVDFYRCEAYLYRQIIENLESQEIDYFDKAKAFLPINLSKFHFKPLSKPLREYQERAFKSWISLKKGMVILPTGTGKTIIAIHIIHFLRQKSLIVVPTIDLMNQWSLVLEMLTPEVGMVGGGAHEVKDITVTTYDSASLKMDFLGNQFGLIIFDECHHLPSQRNQLAARLCMAPYRLGLSATPEREYGETLYEELIGPIVHLEEIHHLRKTVLSPYEVKTIEIELTPEERAEYEKNRKIYIDFIRTKRIDFKNPYGWSQFLSACGRAKNGREVFNAYLLQKRIAAHGQNKLSVIWGILQNHLEERTIVFTSENHSAYEIGRAFFLPVLTHQTKAKERKSLLSHFKTGHYNILVTNKVLNEGVDVPEASIGIIASGSGSVREHVQRLGRILRRVDGKKAILYELVSSRTSEKSISYRRKQHNAYKRFD